MRKPSYRVTPDVVDTIYRLRTKSKMTFSEIANISNVSDATAKNIWFLIKNAQQGCLVDPSMRGLSMAVCSYINTTFGPNIKPSENQVINKNDETLISVLTKVANELERHNNLMERIIKKFEYSS